MKLASFNAKHDKTIRQHTDELLKNLDVLYNLKYIKNDYIYSLTKVACEYHDYGKVNREFQKRIREHNNFNPNTEIAHNILSLYFINEKEFETKKDYYKVGFAVLQHHNYCDNLRTIQDKESKQLIKNLLADFETYPLKLNTPSNIKTIAENEDAILIKGFLHKCDYSASGEIPIEYQNDFLNSGLEYYLSEKLKSKWNNLQQFCKENSNNNIIIVAQTGIGKTEAGLLWIGNNKGFFILPIKTAINSIYQRVKDNILDNHDIETKLALLHSDTLSYYESEKQNEMDIMDYYNRSKQLSIPLTISTLDQLFDFVFKYHGYEVKLATLSYAKVVIDEIQMYSADLLAYLIYGIKKIIEFGGKVAILTATLPPFINDLLRTGKNPIQFNEGTFINDINRHNIKVYQSKINSEVIYTKFKQNIEKGKSNKILVVCNTVKKAQQIYTELLEKGVKLNILHRKFIKCEREVKEKEILEFGKTEKSGECIWICTQIVEASLDIDFDFLFTELSDLSGLFQRLGRCNRKGKKTIEEPNCFVFLDTDSNLFTNGTKGFIDRKIFELSRLALEKVDGLLTESDKINMINEYLTTENLKGSEYLKNYSSFTKWIEGLTPYEIDKKDINLRNIVSYDIIPIRIYQENHEEIDGNARNLLKTPTKNLTKEELDNYKLEKIRLREEIKKYTVPVGRYDIYFKGSDAIIKKVHLGRNEFIYVVNCNYNELGFIPMTNKD